MRYSKLTIISIIIYLLNINIARGQERIFYVIDSIPFNNNNPFVNLTDKEEMVLYNDEIASINITTDCKEIKNLGYNVDTVVFVITREFLNRPLEFKKIPNAKSLNFYSALFYDSNQEHPYTGPFVDFFVNGKIKSKGFIKNGVIEGILYEYDQMGRVEFERDYLKGMPSRTYRQYWSNGKMCSKVERESQFERQCEYSSNGKLLSTFTYEYDGIKIKYSKQQIKTFKTAKEILPKKYFKDELNYKNIIKFYKSNSRDFDPDAYYTYFSLGTTLFCFGEVDLAINMLDTALLKEPLDFNSRICRVQCLMDRLENSTNQNNDYDRIKICLDIQELKNNGYKHKCKYEYEKEDGTAFYFNVDIDAIQTKYCSKTNAP